MRALVLMGSGETSPTMVKTHRALLDGLGAGEPVLLDTPFGFQSNADELTARARQYFAESVGCALGVASFRAVEEVGTASYEAAMAAVRSAPFVFAGPGSPTYALRTWRASVLPSLLEEKLRPGGTGGVVTFASAAALTVGIATVPVYEIYKVGEPPRWAEGLGLLEAATGSRLSAAVIPHFNNAEGGTHDTRYCYLGEERLRLMEAQLPPGAFVLGVDEHTGLVLDLDAGSASVVGVGGVTVRAGAGSVRVLPAGSVCSIEELWPGAGAEGRPSPSDAGTPAPAPDGGAAVAPRSGESPLLASVREAEAAFDAAMQQRDVDAAVQVALDLEAELRAWATETFSSDEFERATGALRAMVVRLGAAAVDGVRDPRDVVGPFVEALLAVRAAARSERRWAAADQVRDTLVRLGVEVRDTAGGVAWDLADE